MNTIDISDRIFDKGKFLGQMQALRANFSDGVYNTLDFGYYSPVKGENDDTKYSLVIFIHGIGHGHEQRSQINDSFFPYMSGKSMQDKFNSGGAHILLPRIPKSNFLFKKKLLQGLIDDYIIKNINNVDVNNIFVMGSSAGGVMAWNLMVDNPELYKKALITCAPKIPTKNELKKVQDIPIWMVSAKRDPIVPFLSQKLTRSRLKDNTRIPEQCRFTVFPGEVYSPDGKTIGIPHFLAKVITTDFIPLCLPNYEKIRYTGEDYPGAYTISASDIETPTNGIINRLNNE